MPKVVSRRISTILRKLLAKPEIRRPVQPRDKPVNYGLGNEIEPVDGSESGRIEEALQHELSKEKGNRIRGSLWGGPSAPPPGFRPASVNHPQAPAHTIPSEPAWRRAPA